MSTELLFQFFTETRKLGDVFVRVPVPSWKAVVRSTPELHEPHSALEQPPGDQTVAAEVLGRRLVESVEALRRLGFL